MKDRLDKTTNRIEGWHRGLEANIGMDHPNVFKLINALRSIQQMNMVIVEKLIAGEKPRQGNKIYQLVSERLRNAVTKFDDDSPLLEFLRGCAHNVSL